MEKLGDIVGGRGGDRGLFVAKPILDDWGKPGRRCAGRARRCAASPPGALSMRSLLPVLFLTIAIAGPVTAAPAPNDTLIVRGERVGPIALGMTEAQLATAMGGPGAVQHQGTITICSWGQVAAEVAD